MLLRLLDGPLKGREFDVERGIRRFQVPYMPECPVFHHETDDPIRVCGHGVATYYVTRIFDDERGEMLVGNVVSDYEPYTQVLCRGQFGPEWRNEMPVREYLKQKRGE